MTISNVGDPPMHVESAKIVPVPGAPANAPQDFTIDSDECSGHTLTANSNCHIRIRFTPSASGEREAALAVETDSPESPTLQLLTGIGAAPPSPRVSPGAGGILGSQTVFVSSAQIAALLAGELTPSGKAARIAALLKRGGFAVLFRALEAGTAVIDWYELPAGATLAKKARPKPVLVGAGHQTISAPGTATIKIRLTPAGKRLLKHAKTLKLTAKGIFTPAGKTPVRATKVFVLKR